MRDNASSQPAAPTTIWTPANIVTLIRILLVPVFFVACVSPWPTWFPDWNEAELLKPWLAALLFVVLTMITGEMWTRFEWGVWWSWEPRLTTYLILMLIVIAYFVLRSSVDEPERRATFAAVVAIIATIDVPICFMITRLIPSSIHPVVLREGGMSPEMGMCVGLCALGMLLVGFVLYRTRFNQVRLTQRVEALKETLDDER